MAVAFDAVGPNSSGAIGSGVATLSWTHTNVGDGVAIATWGVASDSPDAGHTLTCALDPAGANTPFTALGTRHSNDQGQGFGTLFGLANVSTGSHTVKLTYSVAASDGLLGGSVSYTGADTVTANAFGTAATAIGSSTAPAVTVNSTAAGNMAAGGACIGSPTISNSNTSRWAQSPGGSTGASNAAQEDAAAGGNVTLTWSGTTSDWWAAVGAEVKAAAAAGGGGPARPGRTWLRRFHHRQAPQPAFTPDTGLGPGQRTMLGKRTQAADSTRATYT